MFDARPNVIPFFKNLNLILRKENTVWTRKMMKKQMTQKKRRNENSEKQNVGKK